MPVAQQKREQMLAFDCVTRSQIQCRDQIWILKAWPDADFDAVTRC